ncbi:hypothetical protein [Maridesulfovibrio sp.]|uniref:hypothetical protein n=1 Tax=Maridesulfovibrio sp. TaxID=2795000 RepID=UPI0039EEB6A2
MALLLPIIGCQTTGPQSAAPVIETDPNFIEISDKTDAFNKGYFQVVGQGSGNNKSMALLAARSVAQARLVEIINGVEVERQTLVDQGKISSDQLQINSSGLVRFASVSAERYNPADKTAEVCMRLSLRTGGFGDLVGEMVDDVK